MADFDWSDIQSGAGGNFKDYAPDGEHTVKVKDVTSRESSTGTIWIEINFEEDDDYKYPKISHPLSFKNDKWRMWHFKEIFRALGADDDAAKKAVESCESKSGNENIAKAYVAAYNRLAAKHPELTIVVSGEEGSNGKIYARGDFKGQLAMGDRDSSTSSPKAQEDASDDVEEEDTTMSTDDLPF